MKKVIFILVALISMGICSCSHDNSCVKEIIAIIDAQDPAYDSTKEFDPDNLFTRPDGNVFANPQIKAIIDQHKDYKLTDEDKEMLNKCIDRFIPEPGPEPGYTESGRVLKKMQKSEREKNLADINAAKTLGDLL